MTTLDLFSPRLRAQLAAAEDAERQERARVAALPCVVAAAAGADLTARVDACDAAGTCTVCLDGPAALRSPASLRLDLESGRHVCPRLVEAMHRTEAEARLRAAKVPAKILDRVLAAMPLRIAGGTSAPPPRPPPLASTDALRLVQAFLAQRPCTVWTGPATAAAAVHLSGEEWLLAIGGPTGIGKSIAAATAIRDRGGLWLRATMVDKSRATKRAAETAQLVVLDDLGEEWLTGKPTDRLRAAIAELLCTRHAAALPVVVTTNIGDGELFAARYGRRVADRMSDGGRFVVLDGDSLRGKGPVKLFNIGADESAPVPTTPAVAVARP